MQMMSRREDKRILEQMAEQYEKLARRRGSPGAAATQRRRAGRRLRLCVKKMASKPFWVAGGSQS